MCLTTLLTLVNLIGWLTKLSVRTFQQLSLIHIRGNFVYHHWGFTSIYRLLSYPFRSLIEYLNLFRLRNEFKCGSTHIHMLVGYAEAVLIKVFLFESFQLLSFKICHISN